MRPALLALLSVLALPCARGQVNADSARAAGFVQDAIYARPYIGRLGGTSLGGYAEANAGYLVEDGVTEGFSAKMRRFNLFVFSSISDRITLTSELEFEHGTEEIALETALLDVVLHPALTFRAGVLLPPIGAFNQNHDSPAWEFVDRPLVSTEIIPATLSEVGLGLHGKVYTGTGLGISYSTYLTNGLASGVVLNDRGRTSIAAGKSEESLGEDNNGRPALSGRLALRHGTLGEVGLSAYGGAYNTFQQEGVTVDEVRRLFLAALDINTRVLGVGLRGEVAWAHVDVPESLSDEFGERQWGAFVDAVVPVWRRGGVRLSANLRLERVDYNVGTFTARTVGEGSPAVGDRIYDEVWAVVPGLSLRPAAETVFKLNYRRQWYRDLAGNAATVMGGVQMGFTTYF